MVPSLMRVADGAPDPRVHTPERLLAQIAAHADRAAFVALFEMFAPKVKTYLIRLGLAADRAEELAQETMLTVWRKAAGFDPALGSASTWIFRIARNLRIDVARREAGAILVSADAADPILPEASVPPAERPEDLFDAGERAARLHRALGALPPEQAQVVRLAFLDERSHPEVGAVLGIPLGTVKSRLRLAITHLRRLLEDV